MKQMAQAPMNWIEEIKKLRGPSQSDAGLAADLGVSKQFLSDVLAGKKELSLKLKCLVWTKGCHQLDLEAALAFLPLKVATELLRLHRESTESRNGKVNLSPKQEFDDWTKDLLALRDAHGMTDAELAAALQVSGAYLSTVLSQKVPLSWSKKVSVWQRREYDLSRNTVLSFLPANLAAELVALDAARLAQ